MQQQQQQGMTFGQQIHMMVGIAQCWASPLIVIYRRFGTLGPRFCHFQLFVGTVFLGTVLLYSQMREDLPVIAVCVVGLFYIGHTSELARMKKRGERLHSRDPGRSRFELLVRNPSAARFAEAAFTFAAGQLVEPYAHGLAVWLVFASLALALDECWQRAWMHAEVRTMHDARIQAKAMREFYEQEYGREG